MHRIITFMLLFLLLAAIQFQTKEAIKIDGVLDEEEWDGASEYSLGNNNRLLIKKSN